MSEVKLMIYPEWMVDAMKQNGLSYEVGKDLKILEGIISVRDLIIYSSINSLHMHEVLSTCITDFTGVLPGLDYSDIEDHLSGTSTDTTSQISYRDLADQVYSPDVLGSDMVSMLCNSDAKTIRLVPEVIIGDTIHARVVATDLEKSEVVRTTLEGLLQLINDESPIVMEDCALFEIYTQTQLQHAM